LLHNKSSIGGRLMPRCIFFIYFFTAPFDAPNNGTTSPTRSAPVTSPLKRPPHRRRQLSVGCCVPPSNSGHLRPRVRPSINFFCRLVRPPKRRAAVLPTHSDPASPLLNRGDIAVQRTANGLGESRSSCSC
jgi:hypothetical protein